MKCNSLLSDLNNYTSLNYKVWFSNIRLSLLNGKDLLSPIDQNDEYLASREETFQLIGLDLLAPSNAVLRLFISYQCD